MPFSSKTIQTRCTVFGVRQHPNRLGLMRNMKAERVCATDRIYSVLCAKSASHVVRRTNFKRWKRDTREQRLFEKEKTYGQNQPAYKTTGSGEECLSTVAFAKAVA